jgi:hypothetical protein
MAGRKQHYGKGTSAAVVPDGVPFERTKDSLRAEDPPPTRMTCLPFPCVRVSRVPVPANRAGRRHPDDQPVAQAPRDRDTAEQRSAGELARRLAVFFGAGERRSPRNCVPRPMNTYLQRPSLGPQSGA